MNTKLHRTPGTQKVRRDALEGKRGNASERLDVLTRPDPNRIHLKADDPNLTSVAGLVPFGIWRRKEGVDAQFRKNFGGMKVGPLVRYGMAQQLGVLVDGLVAGAGRVLDFEALAADPLFARLAGGCVSSIDTLYDDLRRFGDAPEHLDRLSAMVTEQGVHDLRKLRPKELHLDLDTTVAVVFGSQMEGAVPGPNPRYHGRPSYHPILMTVAETGALVGIQLRPGDTSLGEDDVAVVRRWIRAVREAVGPSCQVWVRVDSAGDCAAFLEMFHQEKCGFAVKAKLDEGLKKALRGVTSWTTVDRDADGHADRQSAEPSYQRKAWEGRALAARFVAIRERDQEHQRGQSLWDDDDWNYHAYITNAPIEMESGAEVARRYRGRAEVEPKIAELKNDWGLEQFSTNNFAANHAMLLLKGLAYNLFRRYVTAKHSEFSVWRTAWQRIVLVRVPGRLVKSGRQTYLHVPPHARRMLN